VSPVNLLLEARQNQKLENCVVMIGMKKLGTEWRILLIDIEILLAVQHHFMIKN